MVIVSHDGPSSKTPVAFFVAFLRNRNILIQVYVLYGLDHVDPFGEGALEGFAAQDQAHSTGPFVDDGGEDGICHIGSAFAFPAAIDETYAAGVAVEHLVTGEVDGIVIGMRQFGIDQEGGLSMLSGAGATLVRWRIWFDD